MSRKGKKMKKKIIVLIIIAAVLILSGVAVWLFFIPPTISGDWKMTTNPELAQATSADAENSDEVFYTFSDAGEYGDGTYKTYYDGGVEEGEYKLSEKNGKKYINMGTEDLEYRITGSKLFETKLTIIYPAKTDEQTGQKTSAQKYVFTRAKAPDYENQSYDSYETDKALLSEWETSNRTLEYYTSELSYTEILKFNDNGVMSIHYKSKDLALDRYMYYAYTAKNGRLTFSLVADKKTKYKVEYKIDKNGNLKFINDATSASIFSDKFFSDVTYKRSK